MQANSDDSLISANEAKRLAGAVSSMTLWRWYRAGIIPDPIKIRRRNYWQKTEFVAALNRAGTRA